MSAWVFWMSVSLVAYTYCGYALLVALLARVRGTEPQHCGLPSQATQTGTLPPVTVVVAAYNEAPRIRARLENLLAQDYPAQNLFIVVVSDGSSDGTERVAALNDPRVRVLSLAQNQGKAAALNIAMSAVATDFVVFADVRQRFAGDTVRRLMAPFADPCVGAVSGELEVKTSDFSESAATGLYWRMEKFLRESEARIGWLHGVTGAVYALRTQLFCPLPPGTLLDDMWIPLHAAFAGRRIWMARDAIALDQASASTGEEYRRKLRTLAGNWQLITRLPRLLIPWRNRLFFPWFSHKFLRLVAPWALLAAWGTSAMLDGAIYQFAFFAQSAAYAAAAFALLAPRIAVRVPLLTVAGSFVMLNTAALLALPASLAMNPRGLWKKH